MTSIADGSVNIQTTSESHVSIPSWFGEVVVISRYLQKHKVLNKINGQVRFARKRFGRSEVIDFLAVLFGYAISGECTLEEFYQRLQPFAAPFMALFERDRWTNVQLICYALTDINGASFARNTGCRYRRKHELSGDDDGRRGSPDGGGACDDHVAGVPDAVAGTE